MSKIIGLDLHGEIEWHAINGIAGADYTTLCGLDADDPEIGHNGTVEPSRGQKITCRGCYHVWDGVRQMRLRADNFAIKD